MRADSQAWPGAFVQMAQLTMERKSRLIGISDISCDVQVPVEPLRYETRRHARAEYPRVLQSTLSTLEHQRAP